MLLQGHSVIFEKSWRTGELPEDWKTQESTSQSASISSLERRKQLILDVISKHMQEKVMRNSQYGFANGKLRLNQYESLLQCWVDKGRAADIVYLDFGKAFDTAPCDNLIDKLTKH